MQVEAAAYGSSRNTYGESAAIEPGKFRSEETGVGVENDNQTRDVK